jgi:hypothetical protein
MTEIPSPRWTFVVALACLYACDDGTPSAETKLQLSDSAGVRVVELPALEALAAPRLPARRIFTSERRGPDLYLPMTGLFLGPDTIVVSDGSELLRLSLSDTHVEKLGRQGEGPGEYMGPNWIQRRPDGGYAVYDAGLLRMTLLSPRFEVEGTRSYNSGDRVIGLLPLHLAPDTVLWATHGFSNWFHRGEWRDTLPILRMPAPGRTDTAMVIPGPEKRAVRTKLGSLRVPIGFARTGFASGSEGGFVAGANDSLRIRSFDGEGRLRLVLRGPAAEAPVSEDRRRTWHRAVMDDIPLDRLDVEREYDKAYARNTLPAFDGLHLDADGRVWVGAWPDQSAKEKTWFLFGSGGELLGTVDLPRRQFPFGMAFPEILAVHDNRVAVIRTGEWEEEFLDVYEFDTRWD